MLFAAGRDAVGFMPVVVAVASLVIGAILTALTTRMSQRTMFDHRLRLEKEYELYTELWDKLFETRRAIGQLALPLSGTASVSYSDDQILEAFNAFQRVVRKGEPFMCSSVYDPANKIATLARSIIGNVGRQKELGNRRSDNLSIETDERLADKQFQLDESNDVAFKQIEELFQQVSKAIRHRVRP